MPDPDLRIPPCRDSAPATDCPPSEYIEAFTAGYNACKDGVPNEADRFIAALKDAWRMSGSQLAERMLTGTLDDADREKIARLREVIR